MKRLLVVACAAVAAGCGGSASGPATFDSSQVERAFRGEGIALSRLPSNGAEQTAMGTTSPCATAYLGHAGAHRLTVWICDSARDAGHLQQTQRETTRANVVVEIQRETPELRARVARALRSLD
jgi:hypothetical protein